MKTLVRTSKEFNGDNLTEDFVRNALSIVGLHSLPLRESQYKFPDDFKMKNLFKWTKGATTTSYAEGNHQFNKEKAKEGWTKVVDGVELSVGTFDTLCRVWENGRAMGTYRETRNLQYHANQLKWVNLLLEHGFVDYK